MMENIKITLNGKLQELSALEQFSSELSYSLKKCSGFENIILKDVNKIQDKWEINTQGIGQFIKIIVDESYNSWANILLPTDGRFLNNSNQAFNGFKTTWNPIKANNPINVILNLDLLHIPHLESIAVPIQAYSNEQKLTFNETINYVLYQAYATLELFQTTKDHHTLLHFKRLLAYYKDLVSRCNRKIRKIIGRIKFGLRKIYLTDFRAVLRIRTRIISRNIDDEHLIVMNTSSSKEQFHYINLLSNEHGKYQRINKQF